MRGPSFSTSLQRYCPLEPIAVLTEHDQGKATAASGGGSRRALRSRYINATPCEPKHQAHNMGCPWGAKQPDTQASAIEQLIEQFHVRRLQRRFKWGGAQVELSMGCVPHPVDARWGSQPGPLGSSGPLLECPTMVKSASWKRLMASWASASDRDFERQALRALRLRWPDLVQVPGMGPLTRKGPRLGRLG